MEASVRQVKVPRTARLDDYFGLDNMGPAIADLKVLGHRLSRALGTRRVWMLNSTEYGGGVAEMLPRIEALLNDVGVDTRWLVLEPNRPEFFQVTKTLHNLIHGEGAFRDEARARAIYAEVSEGAALHLRQYVHPGDILVVHDPQPVGVAQFLPPDQQPHLIWRCHIGLPWTSHQTESAWRFLEPWLAPYERLLFSIESYIPDALRARSGVMRPSIDPLSHKNRNLRPYKLLGVLRSAGLLDGPPVPRWAEFCAPAQRLVDDGWHTRPIPDLLYSPLIVQVSRFDRLKGFQHLIPAFAHLLACGERRIAKLRADSNRIRSELKAAQLVLAGPDPAHVADDPEGHEVLAALCAQRQQLPADVRSRVHLIRLPMVSPKQNALTVNALQRLAMVVVQNSIREGFGLTVAEAMWKGSPVVAANTGGIAEQIRHGTDGLLVDDPTDHEAVAEALLEMLAYPRRADDMARSARIRVHHSFLVLSQLRAWLEELHRAIGLPLEEPEPAHVP